MTPFPPAHLSNLAAHRNPRELHDELHRARLKQNLIQPHPTLNNLLPSLKSPVLDLGCGTGETAIELARRRMEITGYDLSTVAIDYAQKNLQNENADVRQRVNFQLGDGYPLPYDDRSFETVLLCDVLQYTGHATPLLKEIARILRANGNLIVYVPNDVNNFNPAQSQVFSTESLQKLLSDYFESVVIAKTGDYLKAVCANSAAVTYPRILCQMNIKNEDRWLRPVLDEIARVADGIVILDDNSNDYTQDICQFHPAVVEYHLSKETTLDKARDKNIILKMALNYEPDWILCIDGDELLEDGAPKKVYDAIRACPEQVSALDFEFLYMWNDMEHRRTDGIYAKILHPCLFKPSHMKPDTTAYQPTGHGGNLHCERTPSNLLGGRLETGIQIMHLGYMYPEDRERKMKWNKARDPKHAAEGYYEHLVDQEKMALEKIKNQKSKIKKEETGFKKVTASPANGYRKQELKPDYYYANARQDLITHIPQTVKRVLDVGCGHGMTGGLLRSMRGCIVIGLEINPEAADVAQQHLDEVYVGDLETMELPFETQSFDCILLGDVLEHLVDPWRALKKLKNYLAPGGTIVASLPNIRNLAVMKTLIEGSWKYEEQGILDKTHLRFFTRCDMQALFESCGFNCNLVETVCDPLFRPQMQNPPVKTQDLDTGKFLLRGVSPEEMKEWTAIQFYFTAKAKESAPFLSPQIENLGGQQDMKPTASIIIPVYNNLAYTQQCVDSLFAVEEKTSFEVIVVNNGSTDGTKNYLTKLGSAVRVVDLQENLGFAKGCNRGAEIARGDYLVFLNNDTIVQDNWLTPLVDCLKNDATIGLAGNLQIYPDTNRVQQAGIVCGPNGMVYSIYNNQLPADHPAVNKPRDFPFVAGSCMALRHADFLALNGFDEGYLNSCEDIDLCLRVRESGKRVHYEPKSKIYHYESKTAKAHDKSGPNYKRLLEKWRDKLIQDDERYYLEDGFLYNRNTNTVTPMISKKASPSPSSDKPPRVAILSTYHQRCGLAAYAEYMVTALRMHGINPLIFAEETNDLTDTDGDDVVRCWTRDASGGAKITELAKKYGIDILHINYGGMFTLDGWMENVLRDLRLMNVRVIITYHTTESQSGAFGTLARLSDHCFMHHEQNIPELIALGAPPDRLEQIPLGMPALEETDLYESKLAINWDPALKVISTFGFVESHKGTLELIEAMKPVHDMTQAHLLIIGGPHPQNEASKTYYETCKAKAQELGLWDVVHFTDGYIGDEQVKNYLRASDVIALNYQSSRYEASQSAAIALSTGRPIVTTASPVFDYPTTVTFKTTPSFPLPAAIIYLLKNPFIGRALKNNLLEYEKTARWDIVAKRIAETYYRIAREPLKEDADYLHFYSTHPDDIYADGLQRERVRWLKSKARGRILEIGPANGYVAEYVHAAAAVDIYRGRLHVASALRPDTEFHYGNILHGLPFKDKEFDQVMAPEIFEHVNFDDAIRALKECLRVGKSVLVTMPCADKPDYDHNLVHNIEHRWIVNRESVKQLLEAAGCQNYTIDVSPGHDFYLLDVEGGTGRTLTERAAKLPTVNLESDGEAVHVVVDVSAFEHDTLRNEELCRVAAAQLPLLMKHRPRWTWTLTGSAPQAHPALTELLRYATGGYVPRAAVATLRPDVLYLTHPFGPGLEDLLVLAAAAKISTACTFGDLVPKLFANYYLEPNAEFKNYYYSRLNLLMKHCDLFLCSSQRTAQDLQIHLHLPLARLRINHWAALPEFQANAGAQNTELLNRFALTATNYVVVPGPFLPHKNLQIAVAAFARARQESCQPLKLVLAGDVSEAILEPLRNLIQSCKLSDNDWLATGPLSPDETAALYHHAAALLTPSSYEGFPLAALNALAAGTPVISGAHPSAAEVLDDAAQLVDIAQTESIVNALVDVMQSQSLREKLMHKGTQLANYYSWQRTAEKTAMYLAEFSGHKRIAQTDRQRVSVTAKTVV